MNKSEAIRSLGREGIAIAEIARRVGVRYQFARNVLLAAGMLGERRAGVSAATHAKPPAQAPTKMKAAKPFTARKPALTAEMLLTAGFEHSSRWILSSEDSLILEHPLPKSPGVYSMVKNGTAHYVGLATMGLAKRFYFYCRPGSTQRTSRRINSLLKTELRTVPFIDIYTATPSAMGWNGLPVSAIAGLELGLIQGFELVWNIRSARK